MKVILTSDHFVFMNKDLFLAKMILQLEYMAEAFKVQREAHGLPQ